MAAIILFKVAPYSYGTVKYRSELEISEWSRVSFLMLKNSLKVKKISFVFVKQEIRTQKLH